MSSPAAPTSFADLGLPTRLVDALSARGIDAPFAIQAATIADAMAGHDLLGRAPTGSGKTLAFGLPLLATTFGAAPQMPAALVLAPTRELADQITRELRSVAGKCRIAAVFGGVSYTTQIQALRRGVDILVATPGRLEDLLENEHLVLDAVEKVVIDEADRMADMGFLPVVRRILDQTAEGRQLVMFSATLDGDVAKLSADYQQDPVRHEVGDEGPDITAAHHRFWRVAKAEKVEVVAEAVQQAWPAVIFCRTRHGSDRVGRDLKRAGVDVAVIHGGRTQKQRTRSLEEFTSGRAQALVATDVAARGIHVDDVAAVVHFDPPEDHKAFVHRSGRTARAGAGGVVVSLVQPDQQRHWRRIQKGAGIDVEFGEPDPAELRGLGDRPPPEQTAPPEDRRPARSRSGDPRDHRREDGRDDRPRGRRRDAGRGDERSSGGRGSGPQRGHQPRRDDGSDDRPTSAAPDERRNESEGADGRRGGPPRRKPRKPRKNAPTGRRKPKSRTNTGGKGKGGGQAKGPGSGGPKRHRKGPSGGGKRRGPR